jgi:hypothetical protein
MVNAWLLKSCDRVNEHRKVGNRPHPLKGEEFSDAHLPGAKNVNRAETDLSCPLTE